MQDSLLRILLLSALLLTDHEVLDLDAGTCVVSSTIKIPTGSIVVGEFWTTILGSGSSFSDATNPQPVLQVSYYPAS